MGRRQTNRVIMTVKRSDTLTGGALGNIMVQMLRFFSWRNQNKIGEKRSNATTHMTRMATPAEDTDSVSFGSKVRQRYLSMLMKVRLHKTVKPQTS